MAEDESQDQEQPEPDPAAPGREAEEAAGSGSASEDQESGDAAPAAATASDSDSEDPGREAEEAVAAKPKAKDAPPGAELDPIALEPERELSAEERARLEAEAEERARLEAEATAEGSDEEPVARSGAKVQLPGDALIQATGKRKSSIARVVLRPGNGAFEVNSRELDEYFPRHQHQTVARQALAASGYEGTVDVRVRVHGGGISGQAGAVRHGIARALCEVDPELRGELKRRGLLTRDARAKERRKAGLKKARKRPQFSKR
jgi:small subunit ribosomal protein S9